MRVGCKTPMLKKYFIPLSGLIVVAGIVVIFLYQKQSNNDTQASTSPLPKQQFNVVLISIDTLRSNALAIYGNKEIQTPHLDSIGKDGIVFRNHISQVPLTLPSHASILTGDLPATHGIHDNSRFALKKEVITLSEVFHDNGFQTAAFVSSIVLDHRFGLDQGFDIYDDHVLFRSGDTDLSENERKADQTADVAIQWLSKNTGKPFFLFVHFYDPHARYNPPKAYTERIPDPYLGEVAYVDDQIGRLLEALGPVRDKTLILLTADHGEGLGEHEELTHGLFLYDSTVHVPFLISGPGIPKGKIIPTQTRSIDLFSTILELSSLSSAEKRDGRSLLPLIQGNNWNESQSISESVYGLAMGWSPLYAMRTSRWKYIQAPKPELYDLDADPGETRNVIAEQAAMAHQLSEKLILYKERSAADKKEIVTDPELLERLKSLGYVSGSNVPKDTASLPDPKDKTKVWNLYEESLFLFYEGESEKAIAKLEQAIQLDSGIAVLYDTLARTAFRGEIEKSVAALQRALKLEPENARFHRRLSACYRKIRQFDSSVDEGELALKLDPQNTETLLGLGTTYLEMGRPQEALATFQKLLQIDPKNAAAAHQIGTVYRSIGDLNRAMQYYQMAVTFNPNMPDPYNALGVVSAQHKDYPKAESYLKKSLQVDPTFEEAYFNLGITYQRMGRKAEAILAFQSFLERADSRIYASRMEKARHWIQENS